MNIIESVFDWKKTHELLYTWGQLISRFETVNNNVLFRVAILSYETLF
jgi:hypothetical protein